MSQAGKHSCCARGGAWFKNCGDVGDTKFDHTWTEGIQACKSFASSISFNTPLQTKLDGEEAIAIPRNIVQSRDAAQQTSLARADTMCNNGTTFAKDRDGLARVAVCIYVLCAISRFQK